MLKKKKRAASNAPDEDKVKIQDRIKPVADVHHGLTCVFYGRSGSGKTTLAGSFPGPILLIDIRDKGTDSVTDVEGMDVLAAENWSDIEEAFWFLDSKAGRKYNTVILDTVSQMQSLALLEIKRQAGRDPDAPMSQQLWGNVSGLMNQWLIHYRDLEGRNIVFIAQDRTREVEEDDVDDDQITPTVGPQLMPSVAKNLCAAVNVVGYLFISTSAKQVGGKIKKKTSYNLRTGPHPIYTTKIRSPKGIKIPELVENPSYDALIAVMKGEYKPKGEDTGEEKVKKKLKRADD